MAKAKSKKSGGFPIQVMVEGEKKPRTLHSALDMDTLAGMKFRVVNSTAPRVAQPRAVEVPSAVDFNKHMWVKVAGIIPISSVTPCPKNPDTALIIKLDPYPELEVVIQTGWWEKFYPKKAKEGEKIYLVSHYNNLFSIVTHTHVKTNYQALGDKIKEAVSMLNAQGYVVTSGDERMVTEARERETQAAVQEVSDAPSEDVVKDMRGMEEMLMNSSYSGEYLDEGLVVDGHYPDNLVSVNGDLVPMRVIVRHAWEKMNINREDWNTMETQERTSAIDEAITELGLSYPQP